MKIKKIFIAFLVMLTAFVLVGCSEFSQEDYDKALADLAAVEADLATTEADLATVNAAKATLETQLAASNTAKETAETDLAAANTAKTALEAQVAAKTAEIAALEDDVDAEEALKVAALAALAALELELEGVEADLDTAETDLATAQASILALQAAYAQLQGLAFIAPTSFEVYGAGFVYVGDTSPEVEEADLEWEPANAFLGFLWTSSDPTIATVNQLGEVTGIRGGEVMIRATSLLDPDVFYEEEWMILERGEALDIVNRAANEIEDQLPKFVGANLVLPMPSNESVQVTFYLSANDAEIVDGIFLYAAPATDAVVQIYAEVVYGTATVKKTMNLQVVKDLADNDFLKMEMAQMYVSLALADGLAGDKIAADQFLPRGIRGVAMTWSTNQRFAITNTGEYTRLNDHIPVRLSANFMINSLAAPRAYDVIAKGYYPAEKIAYIMEQGDLKGLLTGAFNTNINLPVRDSKFGVLMTWESLNPELFDDEGVFVNKNLAEDTTAKFNVTFEYTSYAPIAAGNQSFVGDDAIEMEIEIDVLKATATSMAAFDFLAAQEVVPTWFPYGLADRVGGNTITGLPTTVAEHAGVTIEWTAHEDHFDGLTLEVQYLRYQESVLTATFSKEGVDDAVVEFVVAIGLNPDPNAIHNTGRYSEQSIKNNPMVTYDLINTLSYWDKYVGFPSFTSQQYAIGYVGTSPYSKDGWVNTPSTFSGYMVSINGEFQMVPLLDDQGDPVFEMIENEDEELVQKLDEDGNPIPVLVEKFFQGDEYQGTVMYAYEMITAYIIDVDEDGVPTYILGNLHSEHGWNWGLFFVNLTDKVAKIPMGTPGLGMSLDGIAWVGQGGRDNALSFDGYRIGWAADADGNVVEGNGKTVLQFSKNFEDRTVDIPAGGFGMSYKTQFNNPINGVFANVGTQLNITRFDLAPENNLRLIRFNHHLVRAEAALDLLEDGETTTINVDNQLKDAKHYGLHPILTDFEKSYFDYVKYEELIARRAALVDATVQALISSQTDPDYDEEVYLAGIQTVYNLLPSLMPEVIAEMTLHQFVLDEFEEKLALKYDISYVLNDGVLYANTRADISNVFLTDMYQHLVNQDFVGLPTLAEFKNPDSTHANSWKGLMGGLRESGAWFILIEADATFFNTYVMEYYKDDINHLTVDATKTQFIRQPEYNHWVNQLTLVNQMHQAGSMAGRDVFGRFTLAYEWGDLITRPTTPTVNAVVGAVRTVGQWFLGMNPPGTQDFNTIRMNFYTYSVINSQEIVDAREDIYTLGTSDFSFIPQPVKTGFTFGGWFLDAGLTQEAVFTPAGLGQVDVVLYAKWTPVA